ncbi:MAG: hypothetical protein Q4A58_04765 [Fusobacterium sp.]|uniref:hypothetical protein n=1 Tax=Fusobacterium sp. TaxID=68766 RepID=UPI0026DBBA37|nr:hypothetical protein [Fusobacterium sp.]MDO4690588.1 hypothetical protein [Fusobacterium sp.]
MVFKLSFYENLKLKFLLLVILYFLFFYLFIFKNILIYSELKEYKDIELTKITKLNLENHELENSLLLKKSEFEKDLLILEEMKEKKHNKLFFPKISDAFDFINKSMLKNNISFLSFGRSQKNQEIKNISFSFKGSEKNIIDFLTELETSEYYFNLTDSYFNFSVFNSQLLCKLSIKFKINNKFEKISKFKTVNENLFFKNSDTNKKRAYMRIGESKFYRDIIPQINEENKKNLKP